MFAIARPTNEQPNRFLAPTQRANGLRPHLGKIQLHQLSPDIFLKPILSHFLDAPREVVRDLADNLRHAVIFGTFQTGQARFL
jgi:hypothetical protein